MASIANLDAIRCDLDHGGRHTVGPHCHIVGGWTRDEIEVRESPCDIETDIGEGLDVIPGSVEPAVSANCHLIVLYLEMVPKASVNMIHFCNTRLTSVTQDSFM